MPYTETWRVSGEGWRREERRGGGEVEVPRVERQVEAIEGVDTLTHLFNLSHLRALYLPVGHFLPDHRPR
ncbi:hypothetical protein E2C01_097489 [Portunus trituberculatus]|uniref:Uncharacterized protein n=1 Tax=Portunus trituberculatus TaxID=210409 RepID=A0A5B7K9R2_PORTR|nr:hypothetical protein [Portunus trituberculatus]